MVGVIVGLLVLYMAADRLVKLIKHDIIEPDRICHRDGLICHCDGWSPRPINNGFPSQRFTSRNGALHESDILEAMLFRCDKKFPTLLITRRCLQNSVEIDPETKACSWSRPRV